MNKLINPAFLSILFLLLVVQKATSQINYTLKGKVFDLETNETLAGATIQLLTHTKALLSDKEGEFSVSVPKGYLILKVSYIGYNTLYDTLDVTSNTSLELKLIPVLIETDNVIVSARNPEKNITRTATSYVELSNKEIKQLPSLMGESDVLRLIQLTPGVQSANEGNSGFYVRGGSADQNLILLDNAPVYNPSHVLGFFSVFNSDIVKDVSLMKSGISAKYGSRMSSIVDITTIDPDYEKVCLNSSVGIISSKLTVNVPVIKNRVSLYFAGRRSYLDEVVKPIIKRVAQSESSFYNNSRYSFSDLNAKLLFKISSKDKVSVTFYHGSDNYKLIKTQIDFNNQMKWGNDLVSLNHYRMIDENWFIENLVYYTSYKFNFSANQANVNIALMSFVEDLGYKFSINKIHNNNILNLGINYQYHHFVPNKLDADANGFELNFGLNRNLFSHETSLFFNYDYNINELISCSFGLRYTNYLHTGPYSELVRNAIGETIDTTSYNTSEIIKPYNNFEPRLTLRYQLTTKSAIKAAYTRHVQYIHLASASSITLPTDVWLPSTERIKPQKSDHFTLGYYLNAFNDMLTISVETYYKKLYNQIELLHGIVNDFQDKMFEESMVFGKGRSYGIEFYLKRMKGKATGWISYTLSRSEKQFNEIIEGRFYPAEFDRTHDLNFVLNYVLNERWNFSGTFIYATGKAMTIPESKCLINGNVITIYSDVNSFRMPAYHRLDLSLTYNFRKSKKYESSLNFSVFNVYNRANPYFIYFEVTGNIRDYNLQIKPHQVTLFPILPSLTYSIKF